MKTLKFKNGDEMPSLGLGTWKSAPSEVYFAVETAIKEGYRHIDCASIYGNEKEVGEAISKCISDGVVSRKDLWVTSKLWSNAHGKKRVIPALKQTLKNLQLDYLDLFLIHWPVALKKQIFTPRSSADFVSLNKIPLAETWQAMEKAVDKGFTKHIGVSNFGKENLKTVMSNAQIKPELNQVECHPYLQQVDLLSFCEKNRIIFTAYSPLGSLDRPEFMKAKNEPKLLDEPLIKLIAKVNKATSAQVLIAWAISRGMSVIPKSVNPSRIVENLKSELLKLTDEEIKKISKLDRNMRYVTGNFWVLKGGPYTHDNLWK